MTFKDIEHSGYDFMLAGDNAGYEVLPEEVNALSVPVDDSPARPEMRHLLRGGEIYTLCGLDKGEADVITTHPSKAKRTDCAKCREAWRLFKKNDAPSPWSVGDYMQFIMGSIWVVTAVRHAGLDVKCVRGSSDYPKGRTLTIGRDSDCLRITPEQLEQVRAVDTNTKAKAREAAGKSSTRWAPTVAEVARVKELRSKGLSYIAIEKAMEWPTGHGNRPWRIITEKIGPREEK